jgi:hypothetical protein
MRRDNFDLTVENVGDEEAHKPVVRIDFHGPTERFRSRLTGTDEKLLTAEEIDVSYRLHDDINADDASGVVAVTNRLTGAFVLELNESATNVSRFIDAAQAYGRDADDDDRYSIDISIDGEHVVGYEKRTLLVYDRQGNLLRGESLIPSGVEL